MTGTRYEDTQGASYITQVGFIMFELNPPPTHIVFYDNNLKSFLLPMPQPKCCSGGGDTILKESWDW